MRVMQVMAGAAHGGAEAFFTRLAPALDRAGVAQRLVIRRHAERAALLRAAGLTALEFAFGGPLDFVTGHRLNAAIKRFQPDIVLSWMNRATRTCPRGGFVHCARLGGYYKLKHYRRCHHLVANTRGIARYLIGQGWPAERAHYLPNFVAGTKAEPADRRQFFTPDNAPLVVAMGRLHENKAFDVLPEAITYIPGAYLWIAGEGLLRAELEKKAEVLGVKPRTRFLGWRQDTAALLAGR